MLTSTLPCTECGAPVRGGAGLGLCAACALRAAIHIDGGGEPEGEPRSPMAHGDYELLGEIARGGMGVVYRARQRSLDRIVAVKVLLGGPFAGEEGKRRLRAEAAAAAKLQHPNIVAIHEAGELDGQPFYSMALVEGRTLAELVRDGPLPAPRAAAYVARIAAAVGYAHSQGVLHRDLKPSNIIIDASDEPRVMDFGLAKIFGPEDVDGAPASSGSGEASLTLTGQVLGSPAYMPPEQAAGRSRRIGPASDVYSIGAILYELLTGRPPFQGDSPHTIIDLVKHTEPVALRRLNGSVPADVETICLKCLEKDPARRYQTADALARDVHRFLQREPIEARPVSVLGKTWRWSRRHPGAFTTIAMFSVALIAIATIASVTSVRVSRAQAATEKARVEATRRLADSLLSEAHALRISGKAGFRETTLKRLREALTLDHDGQLRDRIRREAIAVLVRPDIRRVAMTNLPPGIDAMHCCFDAKFERCVNSANSERSIYRVADGALLQVIPKRGRIFDEAVSFSPDGRFVLLRFDRATQLIEADTAKIVLATNLPGGPAAFSRGGHFARAEHGGRVAVYELANASANSSPRGHAWLHRMKPLNGIAFDPTNDRLALADEDGAVSVCDASSGQTVWRQEIGDAAWQMNWSADGEWLAVATDRDRLIILSAKDGTSHRQINTPTDATTTMVFSPEGDQLVCAGSQGGVRFFEPRSGRLLIADDIGSWHLRFDVNGKRLGTFLEKGRPTWIQALPPIAVVSLAGAHFLDDDPTLTFSTDGRHILAKTVHGARVWNLETRQGSLAAPGSDMAFLNVGPSTNELLISRKNTLVMRQVNSGHESLLLSGGQWFWGTAWTDDGHYIAVADLNAHAVTVLERKEGKAAVRARLTIRWPERVAFSPDGRWLAAGAFYDGFVSVWDWQKSDTPVATLRPAGHLLNFSRDGCRLMTFGRGLRFWRTSDWGLAEDVPSFGDARIAAASLSPDNRWLAVSPGAREVHLVDFNSHRTLAIFEPTGEGAIRNLVFHPDGKRLAISRGHDEVQHWDLPALNVELSKLGFSW